MANVVQRVSCSWERIPGAPRVARTLEKLSSAKSGRRSDWVEANSLRSERWTMKDLWRVAAMIESFLCGVDCQR